VDKSSQRRPDFLFTLANEQRPAVINALFFLEVKAVEHRDKHGCVTASSGTLLRSALAQCVSLIALRHQQYNHRTTHGLGVVSNGHHLIFVRVNFGEGLTADDKPDCPVFVSADLQLNVGAWSGEASMGSEGGGAAAAAVGGGGGRAVAALPAAGLDDGLPYLVRLLCCDGRSSLPAFGLRDDLGAPIVLNERGYS